MPAGPRQLAAVVVLLVGAPLWLTMLAAAGSDTGAVEVTIAADDEAEAPAPEPEPEEPEEPEEPDETEGTEEPDELDELGEPGEPEPLPDPEPPAAAAVEGELEVYFFDVGQRMRPCFCMTRRQCSSTRATGNAPMSSRTWNRSVSTPWTWW